MKACLIIVAAASVAFSQPSVQFDRINGLGAVPKPAAKKDLGSLEGVVVHAATGQPLRKVTVTARPSATADPIQIRSASGVTITSMGGEGALMAATDQEGRFVIEDVAPGSYVLAATRTGFVNAQWGARNAGKAGIPVTVAAAQKISDLTIRMTPQGVVTGRVIDEDGDPMQGVIVQAARIVYYNLGRRGANQMSSAITNDLGEFRLSGLPPGRLFLVANRLNDGPRKTRAKEAYPTAYYPNAPDLATASPLEITPGAEIRGVEFRLRKVRAFRVTGQVLGLAPKQRTNIILAPRDFGMNEVVFLNSINGMVAPDGSFELNGVLPGAYQAIVNLPSRGGPAQFAQANVDVSNRDVDGVRLTLGPGVPVSGVVRTEAGDPAPGSTVQVRLRSRDGSSMMSTQVKSDGSFILSKGANPGLYTADLESLPDGYYLKSLQMGGREVGPDRLDLSRVPSAVLEFVIAPGAGDISGTVQDKDGKPAAAGISVSIHPKDPSLARPDLETSTVTDQNGAFTFKSIAPGEYLVFAWDDTENGAWMDPDFRKPFESEAVTVKLKARGRETPTLKSIVTEKP